MSLVLTIFCVLVGVWSQDIGYFVHFTDVHIDTKYLQGSDAICGAEVCCRVKSENQTKAAGKFGTPSVKTCGIPISTLDGVLEFVVDFKYENGVKPTAIFMTGDDTVNDCGRYLHGCDRAHITGTVDLINNHVLAGLSGTGFCKPPHCVVLRAIGNHDGDPTEDTALMPEGAWIVDHFANFLSHYLDNSTSTFFRKKGYFSITTGKMRIIAINTQWTNAQNKYTKNYTKTKDHPMSDWIIQELKTTRSNSEKAIIIGHIPIAQANSRNYLEWNQQYVKQFVQEFHDVLIFSLWGHTHQNGFYVTRDEKDDAIGYSIITGSVTNHNGRNTVVTLFKYDKGTNEILDISRYYNDIEKSNVEGTMKPNWKLLESMSDHYKMKELSPREFGKAIDRLEGDEEAFYQFLRHKYSNYGKDVPKCGKMCRRKQICRMNYTDRVKKEKCIDGKAS